MIPSRGFELPKAQTAAPREAIRATEIQGAATRAVIPEATPAAVILVVDSPAVAVEEVIPQEVGDLTAGNKTAARTLRPTPKCSR